ncbi:hypothetical protein [Cellvibrio sp. NN19]|uniref:hypothetical protein n=1 Tax=Cellvibrio chitinivorans TaxID=3102792 RepID=UPI002B40ECAF|nr:hypothetical protein [Cellvibrio sp. NN19]
MHSATSKTKLKKQNFAKHFGSGRDDQDDFLFHHEHTSRPKEKQGKRRFKLQREVDDYFASLH